MHQVVTAQLAARRSGTQSTKTRAEVSGGGAKPYRQKGTGRARQGTIRAPQFAGGGVALGPKPRSYAQRTPRKMTRLALNSALSDRANDGRVCLVDGWTFELPRTKDAIAALEALGLEGTILVVLGPDDSVAERSFANLPEVDLVEASQLTAYEVLVNDWVVFTTATVPGGLTPVEGSAPAKKAPARKAAVQSASAASASGAAAPDDETVARADASDAVEPDLASVETAEAPASPASTPEAVAPGDAGQAGEDHEDDDHEDDDIDQEEEGEE